MLHDLMNDNIFTPDIQYGGFQPTQTEDIDSYGSPQADPVSAPDSYGSPQADPVGDNYNSPGSAASAPLSGNPLPPSGVSLDTPVESFIPQVGRNSSIQRKSSKAIQNSNNYDPFDYQDQVSWSFF